MVVLCMAILMNVLPAMQEPAPPPPQKVPVAAQDGGVTIPTGTRVLLQLINRVSTKNAAEGDQVYMQTAIETFVDGRLVIPRNSVVKGTITQVKRAGRVKGRAEIYVRFDSLTLPNGVTRDFLGRVGSVEGGGAEKLDKKEGKIQGDTSKGHDAATIASTAAAGTSIGVIAGAAGANSHPVMGAGIGAAAGAAAGLATVLFTRGPDAVLERGSTLDMILDRQITFRDNELQFNGYAPPAHIVPSHTNSQGSNQSSLPRRFPE